MSQSPLLRISFRERERYRTMSIRPPILSLVTRPRVILEPFHLSPFTFFNLARLGQTIFHELLKKLELTAPFGSLPLLRIYNIDCVLCCSPHYTYLYYTYLLPNLPNLPR